MREFAFLTAVLFALSDPGEAHSQTRSRPQSVGSSYVCPQCGRLHVRSDGRSIRISNSPINRPNQGFSQPSHVTADSLAVDENAPRITPTARGSVTNVLPRLNAQRARQGIPSLRYDPQLQAVAQRRVQQMSTIGLKDHPPGSIAPGTHEGVGWSSSFSPSGVSACYTSDPTLRFAGAAMATGRDGVYFAVVYR